MPDLTSNQALLKSLACAALNPGLRSVLVFDAPPGELQSLADILAQLLHVATKRPVRSYQLAPFASDDDVWGSIELPERVPLLRLFSPQRDAGKLQLLTIADLAALSQVAARTCTMLIGADVAYLERYEQHQRWPLYQCWLAGCARDEVGQVSPHLLDRFALRLQWQDIDPDARLTFDARVASLLAQAPREPQPTSTQLPSALFQQLEAAVGNQAPATSAVLEQVLAYVAPEHFYPRREIALARFAVTLAQLEGAPALLSEHVEEAARLLGMSAQAHEYSAESDDPPEAAPPTSLEEEQLERTEGIQPDPAPVQISEHTQPHTVTLPETSISAQFEAMTLCSQNPFPEDSAPIERDAASLQISPAHYAPSRSSTHGPIIGTEASQTLDDLAITSTILTALKFQLARRAEQQAEQKLVFKPADLRRYRRGSALEHILMILLDYTSVSGNPNWQETLLPYLSTAYAERAGIFIIKVGARHAISRLQAEIVSARNITVPAIGEAFAELSGLASPLAHGLMLAKEELRRLLQHGRSTSRQITFLVISDGRGNVPSKVSVNGEIPEQQIITREGITDALKEAAQISSMPRVEAIVLNPQPPHYPELPELLARTLGAQIQDIPLANDEVEVEG